MLFVYSSVDKCSAQFILQQSDLQLGREISIDKLRPITATLEALSINIVDMANRFDVQQDSVTMERLAPFMPHCIYQASIIQAQLFQERNDLSSKQRLHSLQKWLIRYDKRWKIAGIPTFHTRKLFIGCIKLTSFTGKYYKSVEAFTNALNISHLLSKAEFEAD